MGRKKLGYTPTKTRSKAAWKSRGLGREYSRYRLRDLFRRVGGTKQIWQCGGKSKEDVGPVWEQDGNNSEHVQLTGRIRSFKEACKSYLYRKTAAEMGFGGFLSFDLQLCKS